jgi:hypothetical protein
MTTNTTSEIITGIVSTILLAIIYRIYKYLKKESLCFMKYIENEGIYIVDNDKQENIIQINLNKINQKLEKLQKQHDILHKSKISYEQTLLSIANNDNNNVNFNVNE